MQNMTFNKTMLGVQHAPQCNKQFKPVNSSQRISVSTEDKFVQTTLTFTSFDGVPKSFDEFAFLHNCI